ncbi:hypothetical protein VNO80_25269 [Phaseolus coccineus]|uniref:Uncharacterized protein n=1 Tax=Phaseolus coccineus TaxID=3886 RepID=A0AAN9QPZ5_PHACN
MSLRTLAMPACLSRPGDGSPRLVEENHRSTCKGKQERGGGFTTRLHARGRRTVARVEVVVRALGGARCGVMWRFVRLSAVRRRGSDSGLRICAKSE